MVGYEGWLKSRQHIVGYEGWLESQHRVGYEGCDSSSAQAEKRGVFKIVSTGCCAACEI